MTMENWRRPIIIIGAGRCGTNMVRDLLTDLEGFETWPCDEINYIWRYGNRGFQSDEMGIDQVNSRASSYIQRQFQWIANKTGCQTVVEKTCANSLRVQYVNSIFPDAKFVFIVRDGRDVVASAMKRWRAKLDIGYLMKKARFVPFEDLPYYGMRYLKHRIQKFGSKERRLGSWGPRYEGMEIDLREKSLPEIAAIQWDRCVGLAREALANVSQANVHQMSYESFVTNPRVEIEPFLRFVDQEVSEEIVGRLAKQVRPASVGKWRTDLGPEEVALVEGLCRKNLDALGYT